MAGPLIVGTPYYVPAAFDAASQPMLAAIEAWFSVAEAVTRPTNYGGAYIAPAFVRVPRVFPLAPPEP